MEAKEEDKAHAHSPWIFSAKQCGKLMTAWKEHRALDFKLELYYSPLRLNPVCQRVEATCFRKKKKKRLNFEPQLWFLKHCYNCFWIGFWGWPLIRNIGFLRWRLSLKKRLIWLQWTRLNVGQRLGAFLKNCPAPPRKCTILNPRRGIEECADAGSVPAPLFEPQGTYL